MSLLFILFREINFYNFPIFCSLLRTDSIYAIFIRITTRKWTGVIFNTKTTNDQSIAFVTKKLKCKIQEKVDNTSFY